jgi:sporulation protein YlmC with PRC-barrel domain
MDIPLDVEVHCTDGACGKSTAIIVEPNTEQVTHFVVQWEGSQYLVPIEAIADSSADRIELHWSREELAAAPPFQKSVFAGEDLGAYTAPGMTGASIAWPYGTDGEYMLEAAAAAYVPVEQVPEGERAIHSGAYVEATDGGVGQVEEFLIDPASGRITHLVLRKGHLWGKKNVTIPLDQIDRVEDDVVYLKLDKEAVGGLPAVPVRRKGGS